ncbi:MAG: hypothetical protein NZ840_02925 [Anaerolineales bacterium]|nr:hypothetical protein [Anaerolineales bacterium]MDW8160988.1 hypothetical protein [Anaerolineales bacterium]
MVFSPSLPFFSGTPLSSPLPLARFLPPYYLRTLSSYLEQSPKESPERGLILDPFGSSPILPVELANAGAAVIVCCNNPVLRYMLQLIACSPSVAEFQALLAEFSALRKFEFRIETYLRSLYQSTCNTCEAEVEVDSFIWEREPEADSSRMVLKQYRCPNCGSEGQFPVTAQDQQRLEKFPSRSYLEAQAASKVVLLNERCYPSVIEALGVYPTRSLYAILTVINKLDELKLSQRQWQIAYGLLIGAFDLCNSLWAYPLRRHRPKQLALPTHYLENNFWQCLEKSRDLWTRFLTATSLSPVKIFDYPKLPHHGEISVFEGKLKELLHRIPAQEFSAVVTVLPRPNQAFWTLCAVWSGWLEGRQKASPLKPVLLRKRYDWGWYCRALATTFQWLNTFLPAGTKCFALIEEYEVNFLAAALLAADSAGLLLESLTLRSTQQRAQIHWQTFPSSLRRAPLERTDRDNLLAKIEAQIDCACQNYVRHHLEPLSYAQAHAISLAHIVRSARHKSSTASEPLLSEAVPLQTVSDYPNFFLQLFERAIQSSSMLTALEENEKSLESRLWWVKHLDLVRPPLSDYIENIVLDYLLNHSAVTYIEVEQEVLARTHSIIAPPPALIHECIASYASLDPETQKWSLRLEELPQNRAADLSEVRQHILNLAQRLQFEAREGPPLTWYDNQQTKKLVWEIQTHAGIYNLLRSLSTDAPIILVIPGSRINLLLHKLQLYPFLHAQLGKRIQVLRFRQMRWISVQPNIGLTLLERWLSIEPPKYQNPQLPLW